MKNFLFDLAQYVVIGLAGAVVKALQKNKSNSSKEKTSNHLGENNGL